MSTLANNNVPYIVVSDTNVTEHTTVASISHQAASSHVLAYVLVPIGCIVLVALLAFITVIIFRKNRMDKLRHHLMPMYSFDPNDEAEWESELLEDQDNDRHMALRIETPSPDSSTPVYKYGIRRQ